MPRDTTSNHNASNAAQRNRPLPQPPPRPAASPRQKVRKMPRDLHAALLAVLPVAHEEPAARQPVPAPRRIGARADGAAAGAALAGERNGGRRVYGGVDAGGGPRAHGGVEAEVHG